MSEKPLDLGSQSEAELVAALGDPNGALRAEAFRELADRGEKRGWEAYGLLTQDPDLARLFTSPKAPFDAVGVLCGEGHYRRIREAWPGAGEKELPGGRREITIDFRNQRLDVMTSGWGGGPAGPDPWAEGLGEVEMRVKDLEAFTARLAHPPDALRGRVSVLPKEDGVPGRFLTVQIKAPRGARTLLVQLLPA